MLFHSAPKGSLKHYLRSDIDSSPRNMRHQWYSSMFFEIKTKWKVDEKQWRMHFCGNEFSWIILELYGFGVCRFFES